MVMRSVILKLFQSGYNTLRSWELMVTLRASDKVAAHIVYKPFAGLATYGSGVEDVEFEAAFRTCHRTFLIRHPLPLP